MASVRKIERPPQVSEVVMEQLRHDIVTGVFALGEKLSETQLAETYGVTKAPVRAAYVRLQSEGLVEIRPQSGTYVFAPSREHLRALCELRIALELEAVRLSMERAEEKLETSVSSVCRQMQDALNSGQQDVYQRLDTAFHLVFFELAQSACLHETYSAKISSAFAALRHRFSQESTHNNASIKEHLAMERCIAERDLASVQDLLRVHIANTEAYYEALLSNG